MQLTVPFGERRLVSLQSATPKVRERSPRGRRRTRSAVLRYLLIPPLHPEAAGTVAAGIGDEGTTLEKLSGLLRLLQLVADARTPRGVGVILTPRPPSPVPQRCPVIVLLRLSAPVEGLAGRE